MAVDISSSPSSASALGQNRCGTSTTRLARWSTAAGVISALGVCAACCLLPFALVALGVTSAWVGMLDELAPLKWYFVFAAVALLGYGFYVTYFGAKRACAAGPTCAQCASNTTVRVGLWLGLLLVSGGLIFEQAEPFLT